MEVCEASLSDRPTWPAYFSYLLPFLFYILFMFLALLRKLYCYQIDALSILNNWEIYISSYLIFMIFYKSIIEKCISLLSGHHSICHQTLFPIQLCCRSISLFSIVLFVNLIQFNESLLWYVLFVYLFKCKVIRSSIDLISSPGSITKAFLILYSFKNHAQFNMKSITYMTKRERERFPRIIQWGTL